MVFVSWKYMLAIGWLILVTVLFFLPGPALPASDWMSRIAFDKWVHVGIFTGLLFLWSRALHLTSSRSLGLLLISAAAYGLLVEIVQDQLVVNRSFDWGDLLADVVGSCIGLFFWRRFTKRGVYRKK